MVEVAQEPQTAKGSAPKFRLPMLAIGLLLAAFLGAWLFHDSLTLGFLLDDFFHVDYLIKAFNGQPDVLTRLLWSNWSSDTTLTSYRPAVSFSLAADYALWNINAYGYHLTNVLLFSGCIVLVGLIAFELCGVFKIARPQVIGVGAGILFAAYPLHPEAVAWIIGRVDVLCSLLALASFYNYLLHRRTSAPWQLAVSLGTFVLALASKEMAVTLPVAATLLEWLAPTAPASGNLRFKLTRPLLCLWATLAAFAVWRTIILGTVVGGYGSSSWETIRQGWRNFRDLPTLSKLFIGASEEFPVEPWLRQLSTGAFAGVLLCAAVSLWKNKTVFRLYVFLLAWTLITVLPTFQIWHIWPNLVGSRLFFLGSAPFCILIASAAIGTYSSAAVAPCAVRCDVQLKSSRDGRRMAQPLQPFVLGIGSVALCAITACWSIMLNSNLDAWRGAAQQLSVVQADLARRMPSLSNKSKILIPTLPQDYKGGPILGRPEYLAVLCRPPFAKSDVTAYILTLEPIIAGGEEYISPSLFQRASREAKVTLTWDQNESKTLYARVSEQPTQSPQVNLNPAPPLSLKERSDWLHLKSQARPVLNYDASNIANASTVRIYISKAWNPITNAPRTVPPPTSAIETETASLPLKGSFPLPFSRSKGVHDVAVMAYDKSGKPVGLMSEALCAILPAAE